MSAALDEEELRIEAVNAFLKGYRGVCDFQKGQLVHSFRLLWYLESEWWITAKFDDHSAVPARFAKEMIWIASKSSELEKVLDV